MNFLKSIFKKPVTIMFIIILSIVLGVVCTSSMAVNLLPEIAFPFICVKTEYVGASASVVDEGVTSNIESSLSQISDVHEISTYSLDNCSLILLRFNYGVDTDKKEKEINTKLDKLSLPDGCSKPEISYIDLNSTSMFSYTMYSETDDITKVYEEALLLKEKMMSINGVEDIKLTGAPTDKINITPIKGYEMSVGLIVNHIVSTSKLDIPLGSIESDEGNIAINNKSALKSIEEIMNSTIEIPMESSKLIEMKKVQSILNSFENISLVEFNTLKQSLDNINAFTSYFDSLNVTQRNDFIQAYFLVDGLNQIFTNAADANELYNTYLKTIVEDNSILTLDESQMIKLASDIHTNVEFINYLKVLRTQSVDIAAMFNTIQTSKNNVSLSNLCYATNMFSMNTADSNYVSPINLAIMNKLIQSNSINAQELKQLKDVETITDNQYYLLFDKKVSETLIKFTRDDNYLSNISTLSDYKTSNEGKISDDDYYSLISKLKLSNLIPSEIKSKEEIALIRNSTIKDSSIACPISSIASYHIDTTYETFANYNSHIAIQVDLFASSKGNSSEIAKQAKAIIKDFNGESKISLLNNQSDFINDSLSNALVSLLIGSFLAVIVIYLFLRKVKSSFIIAISMPISVLLTLICLYLMGITLNMVSIGGIAVGIGMLVDNSIVVLESITSEKEKGKEVHQAAYDGTKLVIGSLIGSTLTSICVFFPILFINGLTKEIFSDLAYAVMFSLSFSLLVAILIIPTLFCFFYKKEEAKPKDKKSIFQKIDDFYIKVLKKVLRRKGLTILIAMFVFICSIGLIFTCKIEFLPSIDQQKIELSIAYDASEDNEYCQNKTIEAYDLVNKNIDNIEYMSYSVGYGGIVETNKFGTITMKLKKTNKKTEESVEEIRELFANKYDKPITVRQLDGVVASLTGGMNGISVSIMGENNETLTEISNKIKQDVLNKEGIKSASDNMLSNKKSYQVKFDQQKVIANDINYEDLVKTLRIGLAGYEVGTTSYNNKDLTVAVSFDKKELDLDYDKLLEFKIKDNEDGSRVCLKDIAQITNEQTQSMIRKTNGKNVLQIDVETYGIDTNTASKYLKASTEKVLKEYDGYTYEQSGVSSYLTDAFKGLFIALIISFFLLYFIMACLFESLRKPIIIIFSFPFAFTGGFVALAISRVSINVVSFIGLIMLMGVIVNDAIVLNERFDQLGVDGTYSKQEAVIEGCRQRLRAVLMTTLTTVLALIPMALGLGKGGELMQPLGVVAIGGMTLGTLVTLILIPCVYSFIYKIKFE